MKTLKAVIFLVAIGLAVACTAINVALIVVVPAQKGHKSPQSVFAVLHAGDHVFITPYEDGGPHGCEIRYGMLYDKDQPFLVPVSHTVVSVTDTELTVADRQQPPNEFRVALQNVHRLVVDNGDFRSQK